MPSIAIITDTDASLPADIAAHLTSALVKLSQATESVVSEAAKDRAAIGAASCDYLNLFGLTAYAYMWARMARVSLDRLEGDAASFYRAKLATARFYMTRLLPQSSGLFAAVMAGKAPIMELEEAAF